MERRCSFDSWRSASTYRGRLRDLSHAVDRSWQKMHIYGEIMTMFLFVRSWRVDWLVAESTRQQKDFALIHHLLMWIRIILFKVDVHKLTFPFVHAISRMDTFKDKKLTEKRTLCPMLESSMIPTATRAWGHTLVEIRELWDPSCNPRIAMSCTVVCTTLCLDSSPAKTLWSWSAGADVIVLLRTLSCVEHVAMSQSTSTFSSFAPLVWAGFLEEHVCRKVFGMQTVYQNLPDTSRSRPCRLFTTCFCVRFCDWTLEATATGELQ